ncbi:MAG: hypothetical protein R3C53_05685 [Pirellulaceae bacterium]
MYTYNSLSLWIAEIPISLPFSEVLWPALGATLACVVAHALLAFFTSSNRSRAKLGWVRGSLYGLYLITILVLGLSSLVSVIQYGHMSGYALLGHVAAAGAFTFLLLAIAFLMLPCSEDDPKLRTNRWWLSRWSVWGLVISSLVAAGSMFLSMLPILDTSGLLQMAEVHRYAGLCVVIMACVHLYSLACTRMGWR